MRTRKRRAERLMALRRAFTAGDCSRERLPAPAPHKPRAARPAKRCSADSSRHIHGTARDLFDTDRDEHIFGSPRFVNRATERARKRWEERGLRVITLHEARHTYASLMIAAEASSRFELSAYMGHATTRITEDLYGHLFKGAEAKAAARFDDYLTGETVARTVAHPEGLAL
jgi:integrase